MQTMLKTIALKKQAVENHRTLSTKLKEQASNLMSEARQHDADIRKLRRECRELEKTYEDDIITYIISQTDFAALNKPHLLKQLVKSHITNPSNRPTTTRNGDRIRPLDQYHFMIHAVLRNKPWHTGLASASPLLLLTNDDLEPVRLMCASRLASIVTQEITGKHADLMVRNKLTNHFSYKTLADVSKTVRERMSLVDFFQQRITAENHS